jgi:hypothetical protein
LPCLCPGATSGPRAFELSGFRTFEATEIALCHSLGRLPQPQFTHCFFGGGKKKKTEREKELDALAEQLLKGERPEDILNQDGLVDQLKKRLVERARRPQCPRTILLGASRRIVRFNVTAHPTMEWTARQLVQSFPWDTAPAYILRDSDSIYGWDYTTQLKRMGFENLPTAPRSPWQNPHIERLIGTVRRDRPDHVIVLS